MIKDSVLTIFEAFLLLLVVICLAVYFKWPISTAFYFIFYSIFIIMLLVLKSQAVRFRRWKTKHFTLRKIDRMSGLEFEQYLKKHFDRLGFHSVVTKGSHDFGADLILKRRKVTIAVQAKRYQGSIGLKAVQEVIGSMAYYNATKGLVVTNSNYTVNAKKLAAVNNIILWDRDILMQMISKKNMAVYIAKLME